MDTSSSKNLFYWQFFQKRLREILKERKIRQKALAKLLGVDPTTVNDWLTGRKTPSANRLFEIADILAVPLDDLIGRTPPRNKKTKVKKKTKTTKKKVKKKKSKKRMAMKK